MKIQISFVLPAILLVGLLGCNAPEKPVVKDTSAHVEWAENAVIYEVNIRQYTHEGTLKAFTAELPRLKRLGVDILWLMPLHPIGVSHRKGTLGSYYSVRDYLAVNPEFGTGSDMTELVKRAHELDLKVIVDWVANHTSWDNSLITRHPEWYKKDSTGKIIPPIADWTDVAALDYSQPGLRKFMTDAMIYWIRKYDIDGFRCDVAGMLPVSFWREAIPRIRKVKPVFMLAEEETPKIHDSGGFDASYSWDFHHLMNNIAQGKKSADEIDTLLAKEIKSYPPDAIRMRFTSNHDENTWNGTEFERMGAGAKTFIVLTFTFPGMPLIYTGQESAMNKRLKFFDKDSVPWGGFQLASFYANLTKLKKNGQVLAAGNAGGTLVKLNTSNDKAIYAFKRQLADQEILVILNLTGIEQTVNLTSDPGPKNYLEWFSKENRKFSAGEKLTLKPWEYLVYVKQ